MHLITCRNAQGAMAPFLTLMHTAAEQEEDMLVMHEPVVFTFDRPRERLIFYPGFRRNPAQELMQAFTSLAQAESSIEEASQAVVAGARHFLFSTPHLVVRADIGHDGRFNLAAVIAETNPFAGALGQLGLQMSILQELMASSVKKQVGTLSIQHMGIAVQEAVTLNLLKAAFDNPVPDPYDHGLKPRKIDLPVELTMLAEEGENAMGYRSKWVRSVAIPLIISGKADGPEEGMELAKKIKADDWRRAMIEWSEAVLAAKAYQESLEADSGAEA